jgi:hypothetical protein
VELTAWSQDLTVEVAGHGVVSHAPPGMTPMPARSSSPSNRTFTSAVTKIELAQSFRISRALPCQRRLTCTNAPSVLAGPTVSQSARSRIRTAGVSQRVEVTVRNMAGYRDALYSNEGGSVLVKGTPSWA